jgi:predicted phage terminase large subunit-like protein
VIDPRRAAIAARCELARRRLLDFCGLIEIPGAPLAEDDDCETFQPIRQPQAAHHRLLCSTLEKVESGEITRLMVFMPPGSAKSTYASVVFPTWFMGRRPRRNVILATYASDLAQKMGRRMRSVVKQKVYGQVFGKALSAESSAAAEWALDDGNEFMGGGILSGITGNRADLLVIDDPIKGRQEADSELIRKRTRAEYEDSLLTRLKPGGRVVIIQTRWHEDDLAGSILPEDYAGESGDIECRDGQVWRVLCIPAEADRRDDPLGRKPGEFLWPEWFGQDHWKTFRANKRTWSALYQQRPSPDEGTYFQKAWLKTWSVKPAALHVYGTSDYAVTEGGGDFTVHRVWGVDPKGDIYRLAGWRGQTASDEWIERKLDLIAEYKPLAWFGEAGVIQKAVEPMLRRRMIERKVFCRLEWLASIADKPSRARGFQSRAAMGTVWFEPGADLAEFLTFPAGRHDDDVDCASMIGRALDMAHPAISRTAPKSNNPPDLWGRPREDADGWKTV